MIMKIENKKLNPVVHKQVIINGCIDSFIINNELYITCLQPKIRKIGWLDGAASNLQEKKAILVDFVMQKLNNVNRKT
ncbi:hypothetical protein KSF78_0002118 [Schistosoma japonicum]|nr:hypothetical protein KSF78_0002118 [Schistosoma japonicum]